MDKKKFYNNAKQVGECLEWQRYVNKHGYGYIMVNGKSWSIHRYSYYLTNGEIPRDQWILHKCDNRKCIKPSHLYAGDAKQNAKDRGDRGRSARSVNINTTKLTVAQVKNIKRKLKEGVKGTVLAEKYKLNSSSIYAIKNGLNWKHVSI